MGLSNQVTNLIAVPKSILQMRRRESFLILVVLLFFNSCSSLSNQILSPKIQSDCIMHLRSDLVDYRINHGYFPSQDSIVVLTQSMDSIYSNVIDTVATKVYGTDSADYWVLPNPAYNSLENIYNNFRIIYFKPDSLVTTLIPPWSGK